jgi:hypothetical protein
MKRTIAIIMLIALSMAFVLPTVLNIKTVSAQTPSYTIQNVDHSIEIMYSGHVVIRDVIHVTGQLTDGFLIGFSNKYGANVLKAVAYDETKAFPITLGVELGNQAGFYAAQINFEGENPSTFTVAFILSNKAISQDFGFHILNYPAYPGFTTTAASCNVTVSTPIEPSSITISKSDGEVNTVSYTKQNLPAFTNIPAIATFTIPAGFLQSADLRTLDREVTVNPAGSVSCSDSYHITNTDQNQLGAFIFSLPSTATNVIVRDEFGTVLSASILGVASNTLLVNSTLVTQIPNSQSIMLTATYNLPLISSSNDFNFTLFPAFNYYIDQATLTFTPPEGAKITKPQPSTIDPSLSITTQTYQDTLTVSRQGVSYVDYSVPSTDSIEIAYDYNPLWSSFRQTFWAFIISAVGCVGIVFWRKFKPAEKEPVKTQPEKQEPPTPKAEPPAQSRVTVTPKGNMRITPDTVRSFTENYEERKDIAAEMKALDARAQKGKIPRRQYKVQRHNLEVRYESLTKTINESKEAFRGSGSGYADLTRQLDSAEAALNEAEGNIKNLEAKQKTGEISIEDYKKNLNEYQRQKDKSDSTISGILLRLREKIH